MARPASEFKTEHTADHPTDNSYDFLLRNPHEFYNYYIENTTPELALEIEAVTGPTKATESSWSQGMDHNYRGELREDSPALHFYETHRDIQAAMEEWDTPTEYREILARHVADTIAAPMENFVNRFEDIDDHAAAFHPGGIQDPETFNQIMEHVTQGMADNLEKAKQELYNGLMDEDQTAYIAGLDRLGAMGTTQEFQQKIIDGEFHNPFHEPHITHAISELEYARTERIAEDLMDLLAANHAQQDRIGVEEILSDRELRESYMEFTANFPQAEVVRLGRKLAYQDANIVVDIDFDDVPSSSRIGDMGTFQALVYDDRFWDDAYDAYNSMGAPTPDGEGRQP